MPVERSFFIFTVAYTVSAFPTPVRQTAARASKPCFVHYFMGRNI